MDASPRLALGVDVGGVLIERTDDDDDTSFWGPNFLETPAVLDGIATVAALARERFGDAVYVVSKCGAETEQRSRLWLAHHKFHEKTGVPPERLHFCRKRVEKAPICTELGVTHFVDDRLEVLSYLEDVPNRYLFRPSDDEVAAYTDFLPHVHRVEGWNEVYAAIMGDA